MSALVRAVISVAKLASSVSRALEIAVSAAARAAISLTKAASSTSRALDRPVSAATRAAISLTKAASSTSRALDSTRSAAANSLRTRARSLEAAPLNAITALDTAIALPEIRVRATFRIGPSSISTFIAPASSLLLRTMSFCTTKPKLFSLFPIAILSDPPLRVISTRLESTEPLSFVALSLYETVSVIATDLEYNPRTSSVLLSMPPTYLSNSNFVSPATPAVQSRFTESPLLATEAAEVEKELIDGLPL